MRRFVVSICVVLILSLAVWPAHAQQSLGFNDETVIVSTLQEDCADSLYVNHDHSLENGYTWSYAGCLPPYYGAFGEAFDLGPGVVHCGAYWLTEIGDFHDQTADCYVWEGGITGEPGAVLAMTPAVLFDNIPFWPQVGQNDAEIDAAVDGEFTVGLWGNWVVQQAAWYCGADENGDPGNPWTCIAPGIGWPTGWHHPNVVAPAFEDCRSMGIGVYFGRDPASVDELPRDGQTPTSSTWGQIKTVFKK